LILIDALYINTGGAKVILESIIQELKKNQVLANFFFLLDERLESNSLSVLESSNFQVLHANLTSRKKFYVENSSRFEKIICLANIPPPKKIKDVPVYILFHNAHILKPGLKWSKLFSLLKYKLKWTYIYFKNHISYNWIVQTPSMRNLLSKGLLVDFGKIKVIPFYKDLDFVETSKSLDIDQVRFAYVADGQPQKNHLFLFRVWENLFLKHNINFKLILTVSENYPSLLNEINRLKDMGVNIENLGMINHLEVLRLYQKINFLLYPSLIESFGLPLIEAALMGCDIISIDKEYVYDVVVPSITFGERNIYELTKIISDINDGVNFPKTKLIVNNSFGDFISVIS
jgi:glycosyltransferase involved in cell wall biosynthesis